MQRTLIIIYQFVAIPIPGNPHLLIFEQLSKVQMKKQNREIVRKILVIPFMYDVLRDQYRSYRLSLKNTEDVFTDIFKKNAWRGRDSVSGRGSDVDQTRIITREIPTLLNALNTSTMLDIPCGDFHWMNGVDLKNIDYTGADIVKELIEKNNTKYTRRGIRFECLNLIKDKLPQVDVIFCRDCLVHLSFADIGLALGNICDSQSEYLLTTTFVDRKDNRDILTGRWRPLNLELAPFLFPKPIKIITEGCTEKSGTLSDKSLGLWKIADIRESLTKRII